VCSIEGLESHCDTVKSIGGCGFVPDPDSLDSFPLKEKPTMQQVMGQVGKEVTGK